MKNHGTRLLHARAAGMANATAGRARTFADKRILLPGLRSAEMDAEIAEGMAEYQEKNHVQQGSR